MIDACFGKARFSDVWDKLARDHGDRQLSVYEMLLCMGRLPHEEEVPT